MLGVGVPGQARRTPSTRRRRSAVEELLQVVVVASWPGRHGRRTCPWRRRCPASPAPGRRSRGRPSGSTPEERQDLGEVLLVAGRALHLDVDGGNLRLDHVLGELGDELGVAAGLREVDDHGHRPGRRRLRRRRRRRGRGRLRWLGGAGVRLRRCRRLRGRRLRAAGGPERGRAGQARHADSSQELASVQMPFTSISPLGEYAAATCRLGATPCVTPDDGGSPLRPAPPVPPAHPARRSPVRTRRFPASATPGDRGRSVPPSRSRRASPAATTSAGPPG